MPMTDRAARVVAPALLALFAALGAVMGELALPVGIVVAALVTVVGAGIARVHLQGPGLAVTLILAVIGLVVLGHGNSANLGWMGMCVVAGWVALEATLPVALTTGGVLTLAILAEWVQERDEVGWMAWIVGTAFTLVACTFAGHLRETVEQLRAAQDQLAERSRAEERSRIAGEVHDVIGHALTVSLLHISSARLALDEDPHEARQALEEAERLARSSLEEVRATVGLMRTDAPGETAPLPGAADIPELVDSFRRAGVDVDLDLRGDVGAVGSARGLAAYRIVQEALTNASKHAPGEPISVVGEASNGRVTLRIRNGGVPAADATPGTGIRGMQERAASVGGALTAEPHESGWVVEARMSG
jgi:signal transduction histidine kinase